MARSAEITRLQLHQQTGQYRGNQLPGAEQGPVTHLVIDSTGLKVYGEGEWKMRKHGKEKRRVWRKTAPCC